MKSITYSKKALAEKIDEYFGTEEDGGDGRAGVKSFAGLALSLGVDAGGLDKMFADSRYADLLALAGTRIEKDIVENGLRGRYNATMSSFLLKTVFGYSEKAEPAGELRVEVADELKKYAV